MVRLTEEALEKLRDRLRSHGERPSMVMMPATTPADLLEAMNVVNEYGPLCEAMFLIMLADRRVKNVERDVLRGAMRVLSQGRVRSTHLESMLDVAARNVAEQGIDARLSAVVERLRESRTKAELAYILASAVAAADDNIVPEEALMLSRLAEGLGIDESQANKLLSELGDSIEPKSRQA